MAPAQGWEGGFELAVAIPTGYTSTEFRVSATGGVPVELGDCRLQVVSIDAYHRSEFMECRRAYHVPVTNLRAELIDIRVGRGQRPAADHVGGDVRVVIGVGVEVAKNLPVVVICDAFVDESAARAIDDYLARLAPGDKAPCHLVEEGEPRTSLLAHPKGIATVVGRAQRLGAWESDKTSP